MSKKISKGARDLELRYRKIAEELRSDPTMSISLIREIYEHWGDATAEPGGVDYLEVTIDGVLGLWIVPHDADLSRVLLCTHGGGYRVGSPYSHRKMYAHIAKSAGCRALAIDYRRTPEFSFPAPVQDTTKSYRYLLESKIEPDRMAIVGDSAGGCLAITTTLSASLAGMPLPSAVVALSPCIDATASGESYRTNADSDALLNREIVLRNERALLVSPEHFKSPLASPLHAELAGFPPLYIQVGTAEVLLDDSRKLHEIMRKAGVEVKLDEFDSMQHVFQMAAGHASEADEAIRRIGAWLRPKLGRSNALRAY